jgi:hypothetical protein
MQLFTGDVKLWKFLVDSIAEYEASSHKFRAVLRPTMLIRREEDEASALVVASTAVIAGLLLTWYLETDIPSPDDWNSTGKIALGQSPKQYRITFTAVQTSTLFRRAPSAPDPTNSSSARLHNQLLSRQVSLPHVYHVAHHTHTHVGVYIHLLRLLICRRENAKLRSDRSDTGAKTFGREYPIRLRESGAAHTMMQALFRCMVESF